MDLTLISIKKPDEMNFIFGMSHFIKTVEDIHEAIVQTNPAMTFGIAFCEASGPCLVRISGNDDALIQLAKENALEVGAGHTFFVFMEGGFPINILNTLKQVPEICRIFCATANPAKVVIADDGEGRGVLGIIDGSSPKGSEGPEEIEQRKAFLRMIGYKL